MKREKERADERDKERLFELEKLRLESEREDKERDRQERREREHMQMEREKLEFEKEKLEKQLELAHLGKTDTGHVGNFVASREVRLVPPFDELEVDKYFQHFEKVAESLKWPREYWPLMLQSVLRGKAQQAYSALSVDDASKYDVVKQAILTAYELVPEAYRQKFRGLRRNENQTHVEFAHDKEVYFERWCSSKSVGGDFKLLKDLVLVEEFKRCVKDDIKSYLDEKDAATLHEAAKIADEYALTHKSKFGFQNKQSPAKKTVGQPVAAQTTDV